MEKPPALAPPTLRTVSEMVSAEPAAAVDGAERAFTVRSGFGAGAAATVYPIIQVIKVYGYETAFLWFGIGQGLSSSRCPSS